MLLAALGGVAAAGCEPAKGPPPAAPVSGIVVSVEGSLLAEVERFTLRTVEGELLVFDVDALSLDSGGQPAPHLREHMTSGAPITVEYTLDDDRRLAIRYYDAP